MKKVERTHSSDTRRVALDARDSSLLRLADHLRGDALVQVEAHVVLDIGFDLLQPLLVL